MPAVLNPPIKTQKMEKTNISDLKYKDIAIDFIKSGYTNIRAIYSKYYPTASPDSLDSEPYRLLDSVRFKAALEEAWAILKIEDLDLARDAIMVLKKEAHTAPNASDRITAASWLGKKEALFTDKLESKVENVTPEESSEYQGIRSRISQAVNTN